MNTKTLSPRALNVIDQFIHFKLGSAICAVPYFNNKTGKKRGTLSVHGGKGSPEEIFQEIETEVIKLHIDSQILADNSLKKLLVDSNIGIDCSGLTYYILNAESLERKKGSLDKHLSFIHARGLIRKLIAAFRPVQNTDVGTLANDQNSRVIDLLKIEPGDFISMTGNNNDRDHILVIYQVEYQNFIPYKIHYVHSVAYPEDGVYGTGIKLGIIEIVDLTKLITDAEWTENNKSGADNILLARAQKSKTEIRRLNHF